ncbi:MAG: DUF2974 domain-containing protein [Nitrospiraceae bacterium]|nr:MAG: DUF2974 domain-containing protein [Nitrospiraceae bacterium]
MTSLSRNQISVLGLVASDAAYFNANKRFLGFPLQSFPDSAETEERGFPPALLENLPQHSGTYAINGPIDGVSGITVSGVTFPEWQLVKEINRPTGFGASVFKRVGHEQYIIAFRGTDGANLKDWAENLGYSTNAWSDATEELFENFLFAPSASGGPAPALGELHFVGQSLGGGLAQYAAYEYVRRRDLLGSYQPSNISLTTFYGFGGTRGLQQIEAAAARDFQPDMLSGAQTAHYGVINDIVHKLGGGHLNAVDKGVVNTHQVDFRRWGSTGEIEGSQNRLSVVDSHRIETGFY